MAATYQYVKRWALPGYYVGASWDDYYSAGVGRSRDSEALERSNFRAMLSALGGESATVRVVREGHWAVGWVEWIAIHESDAKALATADGMMRRLEDYPVLDDDDFLQEEEEEAQAVWAGCYDTKERIEYIREYRDHFEFRTLAEMLQCARGQIFLGYASELLC